MKKTGKYDNRSGYHTPRKIDGFGEKRYGRTEHRDGFEEKRYGRTEHRDGFGEKRYGRTEHRDGFEEKRYGRTEHRDSFEEKRYGRTEHRDSFEEKRYGRTEQIDGFEEKRYEKSEIQDSSVKEENELDKLILEGRHAVREALRAGRSINKLYYADGELEGGIRQLINDAKKAGTPVQCVDRNRLDVMSITGKHQGIIAFGSAYEYADFETMINNASENKGILVVLDNISDPHNLGAIIRTALCAGAEGVIIPKNRAVGLTASAVKASAGAVEYIPVARVTNLTSAINKMKDSGFWISGAVMNGTPMYDVDFTGPTAIVIGSEGDGIRRLTLEQCDFKVSIPMNGPIDSLNASVAAGVLLYEAYRQRKK